MKQIDIFYADDDEDDLMFFNEAIEKISNALETQINLHIHKNGDSLVENIKKNNDTTGIVFLDINMPFKSGFELLEEIKTDPKTKSFPVVEKSKSLGANFYVVKPYKFEQLKTMISTFINMDWKKQQADAASFLYKF